MLQFCIFKACLKIDYNYKYVETYFQRRREIYVVESWIKAYSICCTFEITCLFIALRIPTLIARADITILLVY